MPELLWMLLPLLAYLIVVVFWEWHIVLNLVDDVIGLDYHFFEIVHPVELPLDVSHVSLEILCDDSRYRGRHWGVVLALGASCLPLVAC